MRFFILRGFVIFFVLLVATSLMVKTFDLEFGNVDFFKKHGFFFLFFITLFPRLTLLISSVSTGGFLWWLGFIFCPRILVATLATVSYFNTNPLLVVISWIVAIGGETFEKWGLGRSRSSFFIVRTGQNPFTYQEKQMKHQLHSDAIEVDFSRKD